MDIRSSVENLVQELHEAIGDGRNYIDQLQEKMDELETTKDRLETYTSEAEDALGALENLSAGDLDDAMEDAQRLID